jgi:dipeptidase D
MKGVHSGMDIILGRGNSNKALVRLLLPLMEKAGAMIVSFEGGTLRNAIPRESFATIALPVSKVATAKKIVNKHFKEMKVELAAHEPTLNITLTDCKKPARAIDADVALKAVKAIYACPNGVERMSDAVPGLVETSNNLAMVKSGNGKIEVNCLMRSSVDSAKDIYSTSLRSVFELAGAEVRLTGGYSGWQPNMNSAILHTMKSVYKKLYGNEPEVKAIHAGLECGILGGTYPNWDMISCGPTIRSPHSPDEKVNIPSVEKWWNYVVEILKEAPVKK